MMKDDRREINSNRLVSNFFLSNDDHEKSDDDDNTQLNKLVPASTASRKITENIMSPATNDSDEISITNSYSSILSITDKIDKILNASTRRNSNELNCTAGSTLGDAIDLTEDEPPNNFSTDLLQSDDECETSSTSLSQSENSKPNFSDASIFEEQSTSRSDSEMSTSSHNSNNKLPDEKGKSLTSINDSRNVLKLNSGPIEGPMNSSDDEEAVVYERSRLMQKTNNNRNRIRINQSNVINHTNSDTLQENSKLFENQKKEVHHNIQLYKNVETDVTQDDNVNSTAADSINLLPSKGKDLQNGQIQPSSIKNSRLFGKINENVDPLQSVLNSQISLQDNFDSSDDDAACALDRQKNLRMMTKRKESTFRFNKESKRIENNMEIQEVADHHILGKSITSQAAVVETEDMQLQMVEQKQAVEASTQDIFAIDLADSSDDEVACRIDRSRLHDELKKQTFHQSDTPQNPLSEKFKKILLNLSKKALLSSRNLPQHFDGVLNDKSIHPSSSKSYNHVKPAEIRNVTELDNFSQTQQFPHPLQPQNNFYESSMKQNANYEIDIIDSDENIQPDSEYADKRSPEPFRKIAEEPLLNQQCVGSPSILGLINASESCIQEIDDSQRQNENHEYQGTDLHQNNSSAQRPPSFNPTTTYRQNNTQKSSNINPHTYHAFQPPQQVINASSQLKNNVLSTPMLHHGNQYSAMQHRQVAPFWYSHSHYSTPHYIPLQHNAGTHQMISQHRTNYPNLGLQQHSTTQNQSPYMLQQYTQAQQQSQKTKRKVLATKGTGTSKLAPSNESKIIDRQKRKDIQTAKIKSPHRQSGQKIRKNAVQTLKKRIFFISPFNFCLCPKAVKELSCSTQNVTPFIAPALNNDNLGFSERSLNQNSTLTGLLRDVHQEHAYLKYTHFESKVAFKKWKPKQIPMQEMKDTDEELPACMTAVDHLSKNSYSHDGVPIVEFVVYGGTDDVLYYFRASAEQSQITGAGYGAFLTYIGAKKLNKESANLNDRLIEDSQVYYDEFDDPLQAMMEDSDSGLTVHLKGAMNDLHGRQYRSTTNLLAVINPDDIRTDSVLQSGEQRIRVSGANLTSEIERKAYYVSDSNRRIGHLGIHLEADYKWAKNETIMFPALADCIDLGRYGPFRLQDRKTDEIFSIKNFIFSSEPTEWNFQVNEKLNGKDQIIDITDDKTGRPHELAKKDIPMYVNEVGYNQSFKQNVFICDDCDRVVKYYFRHDQPLKPGEKLELLTNYRIFYEGIRERKGYGWRNLHEGLAGDDNLSDRMERNFEDRSDVESIISLELSLQTLSSYLMFVQQEVWDPLLRDIISFLNSGDEISQSFIISTTQWIAARRIQWVMHLFRQKVAEFNEEPTKQNLLNQILIYNMNKILDAVQQNAIEVKVFKDKVILDDKGKSVNEAMEQEMVEETCYYLHEDMPMIMDSSVYCQVAATLITTLSTIIVSAFSYRKGYIKNQCQHAKETVRNCFFKAAHTAVNEIKQSCKNFAEERKRSKLLFSSGIRRKAFLSCPIRKAFELINLSSDFYLDNTTVPKGFRAALLEKIIYFDALTLGGVEPQWNEMNNPLKIEDDLVMVEFSGFSGYDEIRELGSAPRSISGTVRSTSNINETWYIVWQVIWPVHIFASKFLDETVYSLDSLCDLLGIRRELGRFAAQRGMVKCNDDLQKNYDELILQCCASQEVILQCCTSQKPRTAPKPNTSQFSNVNKGSLPKATLRTTKNHLDMNACNEKPKAGGVVKPKSGCVVKPPLLIYDGPVKNFPFDCSSVGWSQKTFQRQNGASIGQTDDYWFTPKSGHRLRSLLEIRRFCVALKKFGGNEDAAFKVRKG